MSACEVIWTWGAPKWPPDHSSDGDYAPLGLPRPNARHAPAKPGRSSISRTLALLRGGRVGLLREVVVVGHAAADVGVEVPFHRARGEDLLRLHDLAEDRVVAGLLVDDLIVDL